MIGGYNPWFIEELSRRVEQERLEKSGDLGRGAAGDYADYRYEVGFIAGMAHVLTIADEIKKEMDR